MVKFKENDIFALKIEDETSEYYGRYIILIKCSNSEWEESTNKQLFRFKISKNKTLPQLNEINSLEYIITFAQHELKKYLPFDGCKKFKELKKERDKLQVYPDEYGYLYSFITKIYWVSKNIPKNLIYIGNMVLELPYHEYIPACEYGYIREYSGWKNIEKELINDYKSYNLKQSKIFCKEAATNAKNEVIDLIKLEKRLETLDYNKIHLNDEEIIEDSLTYVGGEDEDPFK